MKSYKCGGGKSFCPSPSQQKKNEAVLACRQDSLMFLSPCHGGRWRYSYNLGNSAPYGMYLFCKSPLFLSYFCERTGDNGMKPSRPTFEAKAAKVQAPTQGST